MLAERTPRAHRALQRQLELAKHVGGERRCDIRAVAMLFEERLQRNQRTVPLLPVRRRARDGSSLSVRAGSARASSYQSSVFSRISAHGPAMPCAMASAIVNGILRQDDHAVHAAAPREQQFESLKGQQAMRFRKFERILDCVR